MHNYVSIPQAVSTIAIVVVAAGMELQAPGFNTASGKYYCNVYKPTQKSSALVAFQYRKR